MRESFGLYVRAIFTARFKKREFLTTYKLALSDEAYQIHAKMLAVLLYFHLLVLGELVPNT